MNVMYKYGYRIHSMHMHPKVDELGESQHSTELWYIYNTLVTSIVLGTRRRVRSNKSLM